MIKIRINDDTTNILATANLVISSLEKSGVKICNVSKIYSNRPPYDDTSRIYIDCEVMPK